MNLLSQRATLAITAVLDIAMQDSKRSVPAADISGRMLLNRRALETSLQDLVSGGLLASERGPAGGYRLALAADKITLGAIIRAVAVSEPEGHDCGSDEFDAVEMAIEHAAAAFVSVMNSFTIADLALAVKRERAALSCAAE